MSAEMTPSNSFTTLAPIVGTLLGGGLSISVSGPPRVTTATADVEILLTYVAY
jgi:hypothetical protein